MVEALSKTVIFLHFSHVARRRFSSALVGDSEYKFDSVARLQSCVVLDLGQVEKELLPILNLVVEEALDDGINARA